MSNDKKYTAEEVARMIADRAAEVMKKHEVSSEYFEQILEKSKNKAHEIDSGEEPNNDDAECPPSLCENGESEKSESSESTSMEDQPLQGDEDSDTEKEEVEEKDDDEEDEKDEYQFKKSESGMHTVEYKRLTKGYMQKAKVDEGMSAGKKHKMREERNKDFKPHQKEKVTADGLKPFRPEDSEKQSKLKQKLQEKHPKMPSKDHLEYPMAASEDEEGGKENPSFDREKKDVEWTGNQKKMIDSTKPGSKPSSRKDQAKFIAEAKERRKKMRAEGLFNSEKEDMDKCGDMTSGKKLKKFMSKKSQK